MALKPREKVLVDWRGYKTAFIRSLLPSCFSDPAFSPPEQLGLKLTGGRLGDGSFWGNPDPWPTPGPVCCRAALDVGARKGRKGSGGGPSWKAPLLLEEFNSRELSRRLGLGDQRVKLWFQNGREGGCRRDGGDMLTAGAGSRLGAWQPFSPGVLRAGASFWSFEPRSPEPLFLEYHSGVGRF